MSDEQNGQDNAREIERKKRKEEERKEGRKKLFIAIVKRAMRPSWL
jgi:hypothetical protein